MTVMSKKGFLISRLPDGCAECEFKYKFLGRRSCLLYARMKKETKWIHTYDLCRRPRWCPWIPEPQTGKEDKALICKIFLQVLRATRQFDDLEELAYEKDGITRMETVTARFKNGGVRWIDVTADSGWAMIQDIVNRIDG